MQTIGLEGLLAPVTQDEFFKACWPGKPLFIPASAAKLKALLDLPQLQTVEALVAARLTKVRACLPDFDDEYSSILVEPDDALKLYRNNMTLVFDAMQTQSEIILGALKKIQSDLGLVTELTRARSMAYATPAGGRTRLHFDANANFVIQIKGSKRWGIAPNTSVDNPTERYTSCTGEMEAALETQCHAPLLNELPDGSPEFLMTPGSVLFVPRGYWHETMTEDDSLSLNFTFSQPTWAEVVTRSLYERLLESAEWRALADGLESADPGRKNAAVACLEKMTEKARSKTA